MLSPVAKDLYTSSPLLLDKALFALDRMEEVVVLLGPVGEDLCRQMQGILSRDEWRQG